MEVKYHNKETNLVFPNVDWVFGTECKEDDEDCECCSQDDAKCDHNVSDAEMEESSQDHPNESIENQEIEQQPTIEINKENHEENHDEEQTEEEDDERMMTRQETVRQSRKWTKLQMKWTERLKQ